MSNRLNLLLTRLPSHFAKDNDSNNYKLLSLIAKGSDETRAVYDTMLKFWDVDQSEGIGLDRLGKDEGILRGGWDDEEYRKMIKIQCILNLSEGDIDTMNQIMDAYMGKDFVGFEEGWKDFEPATLLLNIRASSKTVPDSLVSRIKAGGVGIYIHLNELNEFMLLHAGTYAWPFNNGKITGRFRTGSVDAAIGKEHLNIQENPYRFLVSGRVCGRFRAGGGTD